ERWALTPPFHPYPAHSQSDQPVGLAIACLRATAEFNADPIQNGLGGMFSVALSVRMPRGIAARVYPGRTKRTGYAASRPAEFGLSSPNLRWKRFSAFPKSAVNLTEA